MPRPLPSQIAASLATAERRLDQLHADSRIDAAELARLHDLLLHPQPESAHAE